MVADSSPQLPFPPSERDFDVYQAVVVEGQSTRQAARDAGVSQTRVMQIAARVAEWIAREVPPTERLTAAERLNVAVDLAGRRMDHLYRTALGAWEQSKGRKTVERCSHVGEAIVTTESCGDVRYLNQAARIVERAARMVRQDSKAEQKGAPRQAAREAEPSAAPTAADGAGQAAPEVLPAQCPAPPIRDCSAPPACPSAAPSGCSAPEPATADRVTTSDEAERRRSELLSELEIDSRPVQPPLALSRAMPLDEPADEAEEVLLPLAAGAESVGHVFPPARRQLNRKQRRARQRRLEQDQRRKAK
jgi:hypothetical protein